MIFATYTYVIGPAIALFFGVLLMLELGRRLGSGPDQEKGVSAIEGAMLGLMGLVIAFSFSGAMSRFDLRRAQVVEESNAIGTAWLRLDVLPESARPALRERFRAYVDSRLEIYRRIPDIPAVREAMATSAAIQQEIWALAIAATGPSGDPGARVIVLPALNEMIDITSTRTAALLFHPPAPVFWMLFSVILISALLAGYDLLTDRSYMHRVVFAAIAALTVYLILEVEYGRIGLIRLDSADQFLIELRASMG